MRKRINREDIIQTGMALIALHGYHATGIQQITRALDMPKGSFYNHFLNKEAFGLEVLRAYEARSLARLDACLRDTRRAPLARIRRFFEGMIEEFVGDHRFRLGCLAGNIASEMGDVNEPFAAATLRTLEKVKDKLAGALAQAVQTGDLAPGADLSAAAEFITNSWQGALVKMKSSRHDYPLRNFLTCVFDQWLPALGPDP